MNQGLNEWSFAMMVLKMQVQQSLSFFAFDQAFNGQKLEIVNDKPSLQQLVQDQQPQQQQFLNVRILLILAMPVCLKGEIKLDPKEWSLATKVFEMEDQL